MHADEFRRLGHQLIDWIAAYRERLESLPVMSQVKPGEIAARFPDAPPQEGGRAAEALAAIDRHLLDGITHWTHPSFFAYFPSNASYGSILGDLACAGLGAQGMSWQTSPACTELEQVVMSWLRQLVGLPEDFTGVIQDTASSSTLVALLCARERASGFAQVRGGLQGEPAPLMVYASDQAHSSVDKAALLAGYGSANLRHLATDDAHALRLDLLEAAIAEDLAAGRRPCAVVATVGTTGTTAVDPIAGVAELARRHGLWLHVDAALAGTAMALPECRAHWAGIEGADSLVFNPHKWMGMGFDFSAYFVRDPQHLVRVMSTNPSYLRTAQDGQVANLRDWGIPLGRRFRALKGYVHLMDEGVAGLQARLRRDLEHARWLAAEVDAAPAWERLAPVPFQTVVLRHVPAGLAAPSPGAPAGLAKPSPGAPAGLAKPSPGAPAGLDEAALTAHNLAIAAAVNASGKAYVTPSVLKGRQTLRVSIGSASTERRHVEAIWAALQAAAAAHPVATGRHQP